MNILSIYKLKDYFIYLPLNTFPLVRIRDYSPDKWLVNVNNYTAIVDFILEKSLRIKSP